MERNERRCPQDTNHCQKTPQEDAKDMMTIALGHVSRVNHHFDGDAYDDCNYSIVITEYKRQVSVVRAK
jgi:hypothetical protein